jgi:hypothetical protein
LTNLIPAGTLIKVKQFGTIGYVTRKDPYPDDKGYWYTIKIFGSDMTWDFTRDELEVLP